VNLTIQKASTTAVSVTISSNDTGLVTAAEDFVKDYNALRDEVAKLTAFDSEALTTGLLFGTSEALRVDTELSRLVTDNYFGLGSFQSLDQVGITVDKEGKLSLDKTAFQAAFSADPEGLKSFFADENRGVVSRFDVAIERLSGIKSTDDPDSFDGLLTSRTNALQTTIDNNTDRIAEMDEFLERQRERLLIQYAQLETILADFQSTQSALSAFTPVEPLSVQRSNS
jgi:flagellar hook-associated protein 2